MSSSFPEVRIIETMFRIPDKDGNDVDFILNREQRRFIENSTGRDIIAKARQLGFSQLVLGIFLARCLMYRNRRCVIVSHTTEHTQKLLVRIRYMIKHMKGAQPDIQNKTQNFITFGKMDSSIYIGTAGNPDFGVGDTISDLHCSEVSRWDNPQALLGGLFQAVAPSGNIYIESTGHGTGNWFHRACMRAKDGFGYNLHFEGWLDRPEYRIYNDQPFTPDESLEEDDCISKYGMTVEQLKWRRMKISELDGDIQSFKEQYPCSLGECFQSTGNSFFTKVNYLIDKRWKREDTWTCRLQGHPLPDHYYSAGADIASGGGGDASCLEIFDIETGEQVFEYTNNKIEPDVFARKCAFLLNEFNEAYLNFERNNHGILFASEIIKIYTTNKIHKGHNPRQKASTLERRPELRKLADWGTWTSEVSKNLMLGKLKKGLRDRTLTIYSGELSLELTSFAENGDGQLGAVNGCHDDRVMACGFAITMFEKAANAANIASIIREEQRGKRTSEVFEFETLQRELIARWDGGDGLPVSTGVDCEDTYN